MTTAFRPLRIGGLEIGLPVVLAPMAGYTDLAYRLLCRRLGAEYCTTEMMLDRMVQIPGRQRLRLLRLTDEDHPIAGQIVGNDPQEMAAAARALGEMGFDVVDLNFACPVRKALSRRRGGYLAGQPERVLEIVRAVLAVADRPVTLKLRQRFRRTDDEEAFWRIAEGAFEAGAAGICVHARSVEQKYSGPADWDFLARVKRRFAGRTIVGSGDVLSPQRALDMLAQTGVDGVAVARGCLGNPWFFRQVRDLAEGREPYEPSILEQREVLLSHLEAACELYGPRRGPKHMRGFGIKYARLHAQPKAVRMAFAAVRTPQQWHEVVEKFYHAG